MSPNCYYYEDCDSLKTLLGLFFAWINVILEDLSEAYLIWTVLAVGWFLACHTVVLITWTVLLQLLANVEKQNQKVFLLRTK